MDALRKPAVWIALLAALLGLALLGSRGIWDPDEGRYTNVGLNMLDSGDWLIPRRNEEIGHWTKPPMTYWAIASSVAVFGSNAWAARFPAALSYLLCVWMVWRMGRRLSPGNEAPAALAYATMLLPIGAASLITTDYVLAACSTFAMHGFVHARFGDTRQRGWMLTVWIGFGLAFLTKGPPGLLPLLPLIAFDLAMPGRRGDRLFQLPGIALFLLIALPWYIAVVMRTPGLLHYFVGSEVVNRVASDSFSRHGEWYGWIVVFGPTLLVGTLPWTPALLRFLMHLPADAKRWWRDPAQRAADAPWVFLVLWVLLPLVIFCIARSRMPLYLLPLWAPLALLVAMQRGREGRPLPRARWIVAWAVLVLGMQFTAARWPTHKDASQWAEAIRERAAPEPVRKVVFVEDMTRYGLHLHLGLPVRIEKVALQPLPQSPYDRIYDDLIVEALHKTEPGAIWICKASAWPKIRMRIELAGYTPVMLPPYRDRLLFRVVPH